MHKQLHVLCIHCKFSKLSSNTGINIEPKPRQRDRYHIVIMCDSYVQFKNIFVLHCPISDLALAFRRNYLLFCYLVEYLKLFVEFDRISC